MLKSFQRRSTMLTRSMIVLFLFTGVARAQDDLGSIDVTIDGVPSGWEMAPESGWRNRAGTAHVNLRTKTTGQATENPTSTLSVAFYLADIGATNFVTEVDIVLMLPNETGAYVTKGHGAGSIVDLQSAALSESQIALVGEFSVKLFFTDDFGVTLNEGRFRIVSGNFDVKLASEP